MDEAVCIDKHPILLYELHLAGRQMFIIYYGTNKTDFTAVMLTVKKT